MTPPGRGARKLVAAGRPRMPPPRRHHLPRRRRRLLGTRRPLQADGAKRALWRPPLRHARARATPSLAEQHRRYRTIGVRPTTTSPCGPSSGSMDGALGTARRLAARAATPTSPASTGLNTDADRPDIAGDGRGWRSRARLPAVRSTPSATAANRETLDLYEEAFKAHPDKTDLRWRDRARPAPRASRHPALRAARRHPRHAGRALHVGRALRAGAPRAEARRRRRLRLAEADERPAR
ncbi:MAG: hypothetical protein M0C28_12235 [Candidatus Moduliflexus flocculans]|nr:hypothetical protein [Candidatus Moduliflexus flocculans]